MENNFSEQEHTTSNPAQGKVIIFSAPSGSGKTTIVQHLLKNQAQFGFSVSACTRDKRAHETHGKDYYFLSVNEFKEKIAAQEFVEWEEVYGGNYYGTLKSEVERLWSENKVILFDVDVIGAINLKKIFGEQALAVFIQPPSIEVLEQRLRNRKTDPDEQIKRRVAKAARELKKANEFDYILVNDDLDRACAEIKAKVATFIK